jgi:hypothetical protein
VGRGMGTYDGEEEKKEFNVTVAEEESQRTRRKLADGHLKVAVTN